MHRQLTLDEIKPPGQPGDTPRADASTPSTQSKESWSPGGQIFFCDGWAWGVNTDMRTVCLGSEVSVRAALTDPKLKCGNPEIDAILNLERNTEKEAKANGAKNTTHTPVSGRAVRAIEVRHQRIRLAAAIKHRADDFERVTLRRLPSCLLEREK